MRNLLFLFIDTTIAHWRDYTFTYIAFIVHESFLVIFCKLVTRILAFVYS